MLSRFPVLSRVLTVAVLATGALLALPPPGAQARVFVGVGFGFPFFPFYGPHVVYAPPPYYYAPPMVYVTPPTYAIVTAWRCFAGAYARSIGPGQSERRAPAPPTLCVPRAAAADRPPE